MGSHYRYSYATVIATSLEHITDIFPFQYNKGGLPLSCSTRVLDLRLSLPYPHFPVSRKAFEVVMLFRRWPWGQDSRSHFSTLLSVGMA